ncbi:hypothetical protein IPH70_01430 [Candidatus Roizmanbacteria bacterium]|nr:MAG: hypothetical protein IPH70_01430 [Candidatus Roizmanbacteria bacterium]
MNQPIKEEFRYKQTAFSKLIRSILDLVLKCEELLGEAPIGLTLVVVIKKMKMNNYLVRF